VVVLQLNIQLLVKIVCGKLCITYFFRIVDVESWIKFINYFRSCLVFSGLAHGYSLVYVELISNLEVLSCISILNLNIIW